MTTRRRPADEGRRRGRELLDSLVREAHNARIDRGLSLAEVGRAVGLSQAAMSRLELRQTHDVGLIRLAEVLAVVGLDLGARAYAGGQPRRDAAHARLLARLHAELAPTLRWALEVPLPIPGDPRAWDAMIRGDAWRYGVEAETHPTDGQALARRIEIKQRDGEVDGVVLLLPSTRHCRAFVDASEDLLAAMFPVSGRRALHRLRAGANPGGNAVILL